jgi:hypothetical protein
MKAFAWITFIALVALASPVPAASPDPAICPVHGIKMESKELRLVYGMPSKAEFEEMRVAKTRFPHGKDYLLAGCVVRPAKTVQGFVCPKCVEAREAWLKTVKR